MNSKDYFDNMAESSIQVDFDNTDTITLSTIDSGMDDIIINLSDTYPTSSYADTIFKVDYPGSNVFKVQGDADFEGDIRIKGKSINETLDRIEDRLAILHPNIELEERWEQLRDLRREYLRMEAELIEKEKMWNILKK